MSSLNPFTARREKRDETIKERVADFQAAQMEMQQQQQMQMQPAAQPSAPSLSLPARSDSDYESEDFSKYLPASAQAEQQLSVPSTWTGTTTYEPPSRARQCVSKLQNAFMIGGSLGGAFGFLYGTYAAIKYKHVLYLPAAVIQAGAAFGFFLACGTVIRCDELPRLEYKVQSGPAGTHQLAAMSEPRAEVAALATDHTYSAIVSAIVGSSEQ